VGKIKRYKVFLSFLTDRLHPIFLEHIIHAGKYGIDITNLSSTTHRPKLPHYVRYSAVDYIDFQSQCGISLTTLNIPPLLLKLGRKIYKEFPIPYLFLRKIRENEIVHSFQHVVLNAPRQVIEFEHPDCFFSYFLHYKSIPSLSWSALRKLLKNFPVVAWTRAAKTTLIYTTGIRSRVIYPAIRWNGKKKKREIDRINLLFVGISFWRKGGLEALEMYEKLKQKYDVDLYFVSKVPPDIARRFKDVKFLLPCPRRILFEHLYPDADIFIFPSRCETFGFCLLEAMSFGLPILTTEGFARREIVEDGITGVVVEGYKLKWYDDRYLHNPTYEKWLTKPMPSHERKKVVGRLVKKCSELIESKALRNKISTNQRKEVVKGKFSFFQRFKMLREIYESIG
jgi:glycosyltransferase involved in cell wall biosynthesis